ncbi:MAG: spherulation-specific family 4 protein [Nitrososphaerota archaeon]|nr:spherulation-specific family 4 protein [Nitrososphaerota archaeon]
MTGVIVPLYSSPGVTWVRVAKAKLANPSVPFIAIVNPSNGPGSAFDARHAKGISQLQSAGIMVLGYVYTNYGKRLPSRALSEINSYVSWYRVDGILFDEMSNLAGYEAYYSFLSGNAKSLGCKFIVGNPGTMTLPSYLETVDNLVIYENRGLPSPGSLRALTMGYDKNHFSYVSHGVSQLDSLAVARTSGFVSYLYITGGAHAQAYSSLPEYFEVLVSWLARIEQGTSSQMPASPLFHLLHKVFR